LRAWYLPWKSCLDFVLAAILLIVTAPIVLVAAIIIKLTSRGPVLYRQLRLGKDGQPFTLVKLRTMRDNAEAETGPAWSTRNDSRVTPVGRWLRQSHIDEFPQLWNVLRGQMSLVGPRPERPEFVVRLDSEVSFYRQRMNIRPGITGLAQLRLPPDTDTDSVRRKVIHDLYYARHVSPVLDMKLLFLTAWRLIKEVGEFFWTTLILPTHDEIERGFRRAVGFTEGIPLPSGRAVISIPLADRERQSEFVEMRDLGE
jgi:lipopolysaccharide/colanic/teichoic acid biosynthesis glycosyltransferase